LRRFVETSVRRAWWPAGVARQIWAIVAHGDRTPLLSRIGAPTAIIHGNDDPLVRIAASHDLHWKIADCSIEIINGMGRDLPPQLFPRLAQSIGHVAAKAA
jgi:pimeloyl-ACP methyl ester carboxylesterase